MPDKLAAIAVEELTQQFPAVRALDGVSLQFAPGEVHGLVGENGAGKSTLMNLLSGVLTPTAGRILYQGEPVYFSSPGDAIRRGIAMVHQELNLVEELSVADNIFLGRERGRRPFVDRKATAAAARELLQRVAADIDVRTKVKHLSIAQQQMVEIAKALSVDVRVLILDEPTAVLTRPEVAALFTLIRRLRQSGVAVLYISHVLPEVLEICDRISVLRDGRLVCTLDEQQSRAVDERRLASLMVGREMADHFPALHAAQEAVVLEVSDLSVAGAVHRASFSLKRGEILGFAGLIGAGRTELAEAIVGLRARQSGTVAVAGRRVELRNPREAGQQGLAYLSEDRRGRGLLMGMSIVENMTLVSLRRYCRPFIDRKAERRAAREQVRRLHIKAGRVEDSIQTLSGGNQQKVALAKWLEIGPRILILDEPTRGVDIGAQEEIYRLIQGLAEQGMACILISSSLNEVLGLCHRVCVMRKGRIVATLDRAAATEDAVMQYAAGVGEAA